MPCWGISASESWYRASLVSRLNDLCRPTFLIPLTLLHFKHRWCILKFWTGSHSHHCVTTTKNVVVWSSDKYRDGENNLRQFQLRKGGISPATKLFFTKTQVSKNTVLKALFSVSLKWKMGTDSLGAEPQIVFLFNCSVIWTVTWNVTRSPDLRDRWIGADAILGASCEVLSHGTPSLNTYLLYYLFISDSLYIFHQVFFYIFILFTYFGWQL